MDDCLFCKIVRREIPAEVVYEDEHALAFLDIRPNNAGHTLVIPKTHAVNIFDIEEEVLADVWKAVRKVARAVRSATAAEGENINTNNGAVAGQIVMHYHVHVIPRFAGDGYELWHGKALPEDEMRAVAEAIRQALS
jgi:histidine triad (HIT) family protein